MVKDDKIKEQYNKLWEDFWDENLCHGGKYCKLKEIFEENNNREKMSKEKLQAQRNMIFNQISELQHKMEELEEEIEAIESGPVTSMQSWREWKPSYLRENPGYDQYCYESGFQAGEQNDRKRTQLLINAVKGYFSEKRLGMLHIAKEYEKTMEKLIKNLGGI